jgi:hypothetical protein
VVVMVVVGVGAYLGSGGWWGARCRRRRHHCY